MGLGAQSAEVAATPVGPAEAEFYALAGGRGEAYAVSAFPDGSAIVAGRGGGTFGSSTTASSMFVARVAPDGSALVAGQFSGTAPASLGTTELESTAGASQVFVARIAADGDC